MEEAQKEGLEDHPKGARQNSKHEVPSLLFKIKQIKVT